MGKYMKVRQSDWTHDFRIINCQDSAEYGVTYEETKQVWISLHGHESMNSIIDTINHESFHQAIRSVITGDYMNESHNMDGEHEHEIIKRLFWFTNDWVF